MCVEFHPKKAESDLVLELEERVLEMTNHALISRRIMQEFIKGVFHFSKPFGPH